MKTLSPTKTIRVAMPRAYAAGVSGINFSREYTVLAYGIAEAVEDALAQFRDEHPGADGTYANCHSVKELPRVVFRAAKR